MMTNKYIRHGYSCFIASQQSRISTHIHRDTHMFIKGISKNIFNRMLLHIACASSRMSHACPISSSHNLYSIFAGADQQYSRVMCVCACLPQKLKSPCKPCGRSCVCTQHERKRLHTIEMGRMGVRKASPARAHRPAGRTRRDLSDDCTVQVLLGRAHRLVGHGIAKLLQPLQMAHGLQRRGA